MGSYSEPLCWHADRQSDLLEASHPSSSALFHSHSLPLLAIKRGCCTVISVTSATKNCSFILCNCSGSLCLCLLCHLGQTFFPTMSAWHRVFQVSQETLQRVGVLTLHCIKKASIGKNSHQREPFFAILVLCLLSRTRNSPTHLPQCP